MSTLLRLATAGSVDDGKSTLVGRLLHDTQVGPHRPARRRRAGEPRPRPRLDRPRPAHRRPARRARAGHHHRRRLPLLRHGARSFVLADCPGHVQYTRNTVTGSSTADALVLLVDARKGVLEQTRRHLAVAALMRVPHVVIAVNKIDLVDHSEDVFRTVAAEVRAIAVELGIPDAHAVPVSALVGDNVVDRSANTPWYDGPSLLELLETLPPATDPVHESFRMPVQLVIRPQGAARSPEHVEYRGYAGQLASGLGAGRRRGRRAAVRHRARPSPASTSASVRSTSPSRPQSVTLRLDRRRRRQPRRPHLLRPPTRSPLRQEVTGARLLARRRAAAPRRPAARQARLAHGARRWSARSTAGSTSTPCAWRPRTGLALNDIGRVTVRFASPAARRGRTPTSRRGGAFLLVDPDDGRTLAAVMADAVAPGRAPAVTLPVGLDLTGRRVARRRGRPGRAPPGLRAVLGAGAVVRGRRPVGLRGRSRTSSRPGEVALDRPRLRRGESTSTAPGSSSPASGDRQVDEARARRRQLAAPGASVPSTPHGPGARHGHAAGDGIRHDDRRPGDRRRARPRRPGARRRRSRGPSTACSPAGRSTCVAALARPGPGWVALVGGGPGHDGLLTTPRPRAAGRGRRRRRRPAGAAGGRRAAARVGARRRRRQGARAARGAAGTRSTTSSSRRRSPVAPSSGSRAATPTSSAAAARSGSPARRTASASRWCPA